MRGARRFKGYSLLPVKTTYCLSLNDQGDLTLDRDELIEFARDRQDAEVLVYGFTYHSLEPSGQAAPGGGDLSEPAEGPDPA